ncbi:unnamed protein product [Mycena citricolor]|uniref:Beta-glucuronidase C-terminal domain-containing protein n=1 Tax=Mycena citricolor TaxID=2018698 RepID=A0AAD2H6F0_9AGAR|nr:unnamed protein product [Mycena citricolor]
MGRFHSLSLASSTISLRALLLLSALAPSALASVTVYQIPAQYALTTTASSASASYSGVAAFNPSTLQAPPLPTASVMTTIPVALQQSGTVGMSIKQKGSFFGFSVEMSVVEQIFGKNSSVIQPIFLNLMANVQQRAGSVMVRMGGNTQESATMVPEGTIPNGRIMEKNLTGVTGTTQTPPLQYTDDVLYMLRNVSSFVNVHWFLGIPWFVTQPFDLQIITRGTEILGDYLLGFQAANEPDLYFAHGHRAQSYGPFDYMGEFSDYINQASASGIDPSGKGRQLLVVGNVADGSGGWTPEMVWNTGMIDQYTNNIAYMAVEKYPRDNCAAMFGGPNATGIVDPQTVLPLYLTHTAHTDLLAPYLNSTAFAQTKGKPMLMFETNTASCGGFMGVSDSFTAALWGIDYALQMAHSNFSGAMFHLGGRDVFYNPFTTPPTNESLFHQWTIGPLYYSSLAMAEALGPSNNSQVLNLPIANISEFTPVYGIYENGTPVRVAIVNYINDPSGANDVTAVISIAGGTLPSSVKVKYMAAASVVTKGNITWAGQTFGGIFASDGRPVGTEDIQTVNCDTNAQTCSVKVPAPGFALVFLSDSAQTQDAGLPSTTFATTLVTKTHNTATINPTLMATSNGERMADHALAGTSKPPSAGSRLEISIMGVVAGAALGAAMILFG